MSQGAGPSTNASGAAVLAQALLPTIAASNAHDCPAMQRIRGAQQSTVQNLKDATTRLKDFCSESDRLLPASGQAMAGHIQQIQLIAKELAQLERRITRCRARAERIEAHDLAQAQQAQTVVKTPTPPPPPETTTTLTAAPPPSAPAPPKGDGEGPASSSPPSANGVAATTEPAPTEGTLTDAAPATTTTTTTTTTTHDTSQVKEK